MRDDADGEGWRARRGRGENDDAAVPNTGDVVEELRERVGGRCDGAEHGERLGERELRSDGCDASESVARTRFKRISTAFEPYQTSKEQGKGLGLAIVKSIIDEHKGEINIEKSGLGATIKITLPITQN